LCAADDDAGATTPEVRGVGPVLLRKIQRGEVVERLPDIRVVGAERLLAERQCPQEERLGLAVAALRVIQLGEVVEDSAALWVVGAERLLAERQPPPVERLGLAVAAPHLIEFGGVFGGGGDRGGV